MMGAQLHCVSRMKWNIVVLGPVQLWIFGKQASYLSRPKLDFAVVLFLRVVISLVHLSLIHI